MQLANLIILSATVTGALAAPQVQFPLPDGFPNPLPDQLAQIEKNAGGTLTNAFLPASFKSGAITALQLLANNEISEVAFFTELLNNITNNVPGYDITATAPLGRDFLIESISAIKNQEELHALGVNGILVGANQSPIAPCQYTFPVTTFREAILLAQTFTDLALSTVPVIQSVLATDGGTEIPNVSLFGSVLGQEAQQDSYFRSIQEKLPSAAPFLTTGAVDFAFTELHQFIVPNSCPKPLDSINLTNFAPLNVITQPSAKNMTLTYAVNGPVDCKRQSVVYISGQNLPVTVPIRCPVHTNKTTTRFEAKFPFEEGFAKGLTIAAVVNGTSQQFRNPDAVAEATVYGPGLIEVE